MPTILKSFSKEELIHKFHDIYDMGWIKNYRGRNDGAPGNILEDLIGIPENNLPIPNAAEWELKAQRADTKSLLTLFHMEPSPTALHIVHDILCPKYGWPSTKAGTKYPVDEMSFRATINASVYTDRGFGIHVNDDVQRVEVTFDSTKIGGNHETWRQTVLKRVGHLHDFDINPYWGFNDLFHHAGTKLINCFYVQAEEKKVREKGKLQSYFLYSYVLKLSTFDLDKFIQAIKDGKVFIDFDARTHHNHGTKFRIHQSDIPSLYQSAEVILDKRTKQQD